MHLSRRMKEAAPLIFGPHFSHCRRSIASDRFLGVLPLIDWGQDNPTKHGTNMAYFCPPRRQFGFYSFHTPYISRVQRPHDNILSALISSLVDNLIQTRTSPLFWYNTRQASGMIDKVPRGMLKPSVGY